jgi:tetratricopeptide (TPR) repeat protein
MNENEEEFSIKSWFVPFTTTKAVTFIVLIGFLIYINSLFGGFIWDDKTYIISNSTVHVGNLIAAFKGNLFNTGGQYRPIPATYFSILYSLFGNVSFFYHFVQVLIHITNAILLLFFFKKFFSNEIAAFISFIFLIHPIQVESVAYIAATGNPLFFLFGMLALLLSMKEKNSVKNSIVVSILLLVSFLTKETGVLFLFLILLYKFLYKNKELFNYIAIGSVALLFYFFIRFFVGGIFFTKLELLPIARLGFFERLTNVPSIIYYYLKTFFFPAKLAIDQQWVIASVSLRSFFLPLLIDIIFFAGVMLLGVRLYLTQKKSYKVFIFFLFSFVVGLLMHSQIFPLDLTVADRWFYFPIFGLLGIIGVFLKNLKPTKRIFYGLGYGAVALLILFLSIRTIVRNTNWSDAITLYTHDVRIEDNWDIENNLGFEYKNIGNQSEALAHYLKSIELFPFESNILNAGIVYANMGNLIKAKEYYYKAISAKHFSLTSHKHSLNSYQNLGQLLLLTDKPKVAYQFLLEALKDYPDSWQLWDNLAISQYWMKDESNALISATRAKSIQSNELTNYIYEKISNKLPIKMYRIKNGIQIT